MCLVLSNSEMEVSEIQSNAESIDASTLFHLVNDVVAFALYMHQQIPSVLQDISQEFDALHAEYEELQKEQLETETKVSDRRKNASRKREVKRGIRRFEKLMKSFSNLQAAWKLVVSEYPDINDVVLILGGSPLRPQYVYELCFGSQKMASVGGAADFAKSRAAERLSRKAIRALISKGVGSGSYPGPTKLFLFIKAPSSFNQPLHFLPKRDFRYNKKVVPYKLQFNCRSQGEENSKQELNTETSRSDSTSDDMIWFQCRHTVKGIAFKTPVPEE